MYVGGMFDSEIVIAVGSRFHKCTDIIVPIKFEQSKKTM